LVAAAQNKTAAAQNNAQAETTGCPANDYFQKIAPAQLTAETFAYIQKKQLLKRLLPETQ
jgi:hypothetical protein